MHHSDPFIQHLQQKLQEPLPGVLAQYEMAPHSRPVFESIPEEAEPAAVLLLLFPINNSWHTVLIERTASNNPNDRHSGQISLPGGRYEGADGNMENTALREASEEVGLDINDTFMLGALSELYIPVSNFRVSPFVAVAKQKPIFSPQEEEVKNILEVPVSMFQKEENIRRKDLVVRGDFVLKDVPYYNIFGKTVWGATAMILSEFLTLAPR